MDGYFEKGAYYPPSKPQYYGDIISIRIELDGYADQARVKELIDSAELIFGSTSRVIHPDQRCLDV
jgi:hypothetical protein